MIAAMLLAFGLKFPSQGPSPSQTTVTQQPQQATSNKPQQTGSYATPAQPAPSPSDSTIAPQKGQGGSKDRGGEKNSEASFNARIAAYTHDLVWVGILQFVAMFLQAIFLIATLVVTNKAATAAEKSANAAEGALNKVERAYLVVMFLQVGSKSHLGEQTMSVIFSIFNSGHTPARIQSAAAHAIVGEKWPPKPDYSLPSRLDYSGAGLTIAPVRDITVSLDLTPAEISDVTSNDQSRRLHVYGQVLYTDVLGKGHFVRFGRRYMPGDIASPFHFPDVPGYEDAD